MMWLLRALRIGRQVKECEADEQQHKLELDRREDNIKRRLDALEELAQTLEDPKHG